MEQNSKKQNVSDTSNIDFSKTRFDVSKVKSKPQAGTKSLSSFEPTLAREQTTTKALEAIFIQLMQNGVKTCTNSDLVDLLKQVNEIAEKLNHESIPTDTPLYGYGYTKFGQEQKRLMHEKEIDYTTEPQKALSKLVVFCSQRKPRSPFIYYLKSGE